MIEVRTRPGVRTLIATHCSVCARRSDSKHSGSSLRWRRRNRSKGVGAAAPRVAPDACEPGGSATRAVAVCCNLLVWVAQRSYPAAPSLSLLLNPVRVRTTTAKEACRNLIEMISCPDPGDHSFSVWRLTVRQSSASTAPARCPSASHRSRRRLGVGGPHCDFAMVLLLNDGDLGQTT